MIFDIALFISRNSLSFYFSQNEGDYQVYEFENEASIPLYFYSEESEFKIGYAAKLKYQRSYPNTYFDYFKLIKDTDSSFQFFNAKKKYKDLLLLGIENLINNFLRDIAISSYKVSDIRDKINLNLVFASDILPNEINFVGELFQAANYKNLKLIYYNYLLLHFLDKYRRIGAYKDDRGKIGAFKGYLLIDGLENNLYIDFYKELNSKVPKFNKIGENLANDPKVKIIAKMLFDLAVLKSGSLVQEKDELIRLIPLAKKYCNTSKLEPLITVELSDGSVEKVRLKMKKVNEVLSYEANFTKDFDAVKECEHKAKIANLDLLIIVKNSITSINFIDKIRSNYNNVYHCNEEFEEVFDLFISSPRVIELGDLLNQGSLQKPSINTPEVLNGKKTSTSGLNGKTSENSNIPKTSKPSNIADKLPTPPQPAITKSTRSSKPSAPKPPPLPFRTKVERKPNKVASKPPPPPPPGPKVEKKPNMAAPKPPPPPPPSRLRGSEKIEKSKTRTSGSKSPPPLPPPKPKSKKRK